MRFVPSSRTRLVFLRPQPRRPPSPGRPRALEVQAEERGPAVPDPDRYDAPAINNAPTVNSAPAVNNAPTVNRQCAQRYLVGPAKAGPMSQRGRPATANSGVPVVDMTPTNATVYNSCNGPVAAAPTPGVGAQQPVSRRQRTPRGGIAQRTTVVDRSAATGGATRPATLREVLQSEAGVMCRWVVPRLPPTSMQSISGRLWSDPGTGRRHVQCRYDGGCIASTRPCRGIGIRYRRTSSRFTVDEAEPSFLPRHHQRLSRLIDLLQSRGHCRVSKFPCGKPPLGKSYPRRQVLLVPAAGEALVFRRAESAAEPEATLNRS